MPTPELIRSLSLFALAGLAEIAGGYFVWRSIRHGAGLHVGIAGGMLLLLYGIIPTFQPAAFGRTYAAYGGVFVVMSLLWGWAVDHVRPDRADITGAVVCVIGSGIIMFWPRA